MFGSACDHVQGWKDFHLIAQHRSNQAAVVKLENPASICQYSMAAGGPSLLTMSCIFALAAAGRHALNSSRWMFRLLPMYQCTTEPCLCAGTDALQLNQHEEPTREQPLRQTAGGGHQPPQQLGPVDALNASRRSPAASLPQPPLPPQQQEQQQQQQQWRQQYYHQHMSEPGQYDLVLPAVPQQQPSPETLVPAATGNR